MIVIGLDPGPVVSALVVWDGESIINKMDSDNAAIVYQLRKWENKSLLVIEKVVSYGMSVGAEVFETVYWSGRFAEAYGIENVERMPRLEVKMHLCQNGKARDPNIRQALIDRLGPPGTKKNPGKLHGISGDLWSALAVAVTAWDKKSSHDRDV